MQRPSVFKPRFAGRSGFTLIEVVVFTAVLSGMALVFLSILVVITRVQVRESAVAEVNQQSHFILRTVEDLVMRSSVIQMESDAATSTLKLRMSSSTEDPTYIFLNDGKVYVRETDSGENMALSSDKVRVDELTFIKRSQGAAKDAVSVSISVSYNTENIQQYFTRKLVSGVERASAAVFDSSIVPSVSNTYGIGASQNDWKSINNTLYFANGKVGVGVLSPTQTLDVSGGIKISPSGSMPTCDTTRRGLIWMTIGFELDEEDVLYVCAKNSSAEFTWQRLN